MEITIQTEIDEDDSNQLFKWDDVVFPIEGRDYDWAKPTHHIVARDNGIPVGHIGFGQFLVIGELEKMVIGVGGVVVRPEYQGLRVPEKMFDVLNSTDVLDAKNTVKTLFCPARLVSYYAHHGYKTYQHEFEFLQNQGYTKTDKIHFLVRGEPGLSGDLKIPSNPW